MGLEVGVGWSGQLFSTKARPICMYAYILSPLYKGLGVSQMGVGGGGGGS